MTNTFWKKSYNKQEIQKLVDYLLSQKSNDGWSYSMHFEIAIRELMLSIQPPFSSRAVYRALSNMHQSSKTTVDEFEGQYKADKSTLTLDENKDITQWSFYLPWNILLESDKQNSYKFELLGHIFLLRPVKQIIKQLGESTFSTGSLYNLVPRKEKIKLPRYF